MCSPDAPLLRFYEVCPPYTTLAKRVSSWTGDLLKNIEAEASLSKMLSQFMRGKVGEAVDALSH